MEELPVILVPAAACADPVPPGAVSHGPGTAVGDIVLHAQSESEDVLLVATDDTEDRPARIADQVTALPNVALARLRGTATQRALIARGLALLEPRQYGFAQPVADMLLAQCRTRLALSSVARLSEPRPSLWQHLRSFVGGTFEIDLAAGKVASVKTMTWSTEGAGIAAWSACGSIDRLHLDVTGPLVPVVVTATGSPWGCRRWAELTLLPALDSAVRGALASVAAASCRACGRLVADTGCPFCRTAVGARTTSVYPTLTTQYERQPQ